MRYFIIEEIEPGTNFHFCNIYKEPPKPSSMILVAISEYSKHMDAVRHMLARRKELKKANLLADPSYQPPSRR